MQSRQTLIGLALIILFVVAIIIHPTQTPNSSSSKSASQSTLFQKPGIAVVELFGPISFDIYSSNALPSGADAVLNQLKDIEEDDQVKGLLLRINSPGGTVGASQELYHALLRIKAEKKIPIYAQIGDVGASGAYYAALAADKIYANPGSLVGSIGVILGNVNITELAKKYGIDYNVYKSGPYKDLLSMWRNSSESEEKLLQKLVDNVHQQFTSTFISARKLKPSQGKKLAQGQIFTGEQAKSLKIIDEVGGYATALSDIGEKTGLGKNPAIISKSKPHWKDLLNSFGASMQLSLKPNLNLAPLY